MRDVSFCNNGMSFCKMMMGLGAEKENGSSVKAASLFPWELRGALFQVLRENDNVQLGGASMPLNYLKEVSSHLTEGCN